MPVNTELAFSRLNLRFNPFGELSQEDRSKLADIDETWIQRVISEPGSTWQVIGPCGFGKSTHLLAFLEIVTDAAYVYLDETLTTSLPDPIATIMLIDEAQRLTKRQRKKLFASSATLVMATHEDLSNDLSRSKRKPITIDLTSGMDEERLRRILNNRIEFARRSKGPLPSINPEAATKLFARHGGNLRQIESTLYELFQQLNERHGKVHD